MMISVTKFGINSDHTLIFTIVHIIDMLNKRSNYALQIQYDLTVILKYASNMENIFFFKIEIYGL